MPKTEIEMLEEIGQKVDASTKEGKEVKALVDAATIEAKEIKTKAMALETALNEKGATIEVMQGEIKELKAKSGRMKGEAPALISIKQMISDTILEHKEAIIKSERGPLVTNMEVKTVGVIASANLGGTGNNYISYLDWRPGMEPLGQYRFRSLCRQIQSETDFVRFPRADKPIGEGSFAKTTETNTKPQVDRDYTMIDVTLTPMAGFAIVSRQSLRNIIFLQSWLPTSMMEQLEDSEDTEFANQLVAAATGSATIQTGFAGVPEKLISFIKNLLITKYRPNAIAVDPSIWASLLVFQPARTLTGAPVGTVPYSNPFVVTVGADGMVRILGIPVYPVNWLTGGRVIVGDFSKVAIVQSEGLVMRQSDSHASIFTANEIAFLLERTENLAIFRPDAFVTAVILT
jgi:hypothetical protein